MRTWLASQPPWVSALFWIGMSAAAVVIVLIVVFAIWFGVFFENR